jgi:hypothetical protein
VVVVLEDDKVPDFNGVHEAPPAVVEEHLPLVVDSTSTNNRPVTPPDTRSTPSWGSFPST